ncbi:MAG TPA: FAD-binding protein [Fibrobacteria bacterium]|nr:FAD-binding protein [Fibrobacteria bacterium]
MIAEGPIGTELDRFLEFLEGEGIRYERDVPLSRKTWIRRGGTASIWLQPSELSEFVRVVAWLQGSGLPFEVVGGTSNCFFSKDYDPPVVVSTLRMKGLRIEEGQAICECGYRMSELARWSVENGYEGFEGFIGLPGTAAGAAINNAGCYGSLVSEVVAGIDLLENGVIRRVLPPEIGYSHRHSRLKSKEMSGVVVSVVFQLRASSDRDALRRRMEYAQWHRRTFQEHSFPNLGTVFCHLRWKPFPVARRLGLAIAERWLRLREKDPVKLIKARRNLFLRAIGAGDLERYVSEFGFNCFLWKDDGADEAFERYVRFVRRNTVSGIMEIEWKCGSANVAVPTPVREML